MDYNELVGHYVRLRDKKAEHKAEYDAKVKKIDEALEKIEQKLLALFNESGMESVRTEAGTAYKSLQTSANVADRDAFFQFVKDNDAFELLEARVSKKAVEEFKAANEELPPGVNWNARFTVNIRRSA
jgi:hypothetical protein